MTAGEYTSHCMLVMDFKLMLKYSDWFKSTIRVAAELSSLATKGQTAVSPSYNVSWSLDDGDRMRVNIGGERLELELKPNRDGIAVWRLVA